jgi:hypothetical protein
MSHSIPDTTHDYLAQRLDGARDLYLLALAIGDRGNGFGALIQEARIHFVSVIEEARIAGVDIHDIQKMLATETAEMGNTIRADLRDRVQQLLRAKANPR